MTHQPSYSSATSRSIISYDQSQQRPTNNDDNDSAFNLTLKSHFAERIQLNEMDATYQKPDEVLVS